MPGHESVYGHRSMCLEVVLTVRVGCPAVSTFAQYILIGWHLACIAQRRDLCVLSTHLRTNLRLSTEQSFFFN